MRVTGVSAAQQNYGYCKGLDKANKKYNASFRALIPQAEIDRLRLCVYDLDDTLLEGPQEIRDKVLDFSKEYVKEGFKRILVYSSSRPLKKIQPLIDDKTLVMPDFCVGNNGVNIYSNVSNQLEELKTWSQKLAQGFKKEEIREFMIGISKKNMFSNEEWSKVSSSIIPAGQKDFRGSKLTEYEVFESPLNIYFMMAPGIYEKTLPEIKKVIQDRGIQAEVKFQRFDSENLKSLDKWFPENIANDMRNHAAPRVNPDGSIDVAIITANADKGKSTEYIRQIFGIKPEEVLAAGDDVNDLSNADKGYKFILPKNSKIDFVNLVDKLKGVVKTTQNGVEGIWETIA